MNYSRAARQAAFRGFRARRRVVWGVRAQLEAFVEELQRDARVASLLLSGGTAMAAADVGDARWLVDGERRRRLHLPRFDDHVFGVAFSFPPPPRPQEAAAVVTETKGSSDTVRCRDDECDEEQTQAEPAGEEVAAAAWSEQPHQAEDATLDVHSEGSDNDADEQQAQPPTVATSVCDEGDDESHSAARETEDAAAALLDETSSQMDEKVDLPTANDFSAPTDDAASENTSVAPPAKPAVAAYSSDALTVEAILATHSREEILLELEWAKQALRDRRKVRRACGGGEWEWLTLCSCWLMRCLSSTSRADRSATSELLYPGAHVLPRDHIY